MDTIFGRDGREHEMSVYSVIEMFPNTITKIQSEIVPFEGDRYKWIAMKRIMTKIINKLGEQSAKAQGLSNVTTSAEKLINSNGLLYLYNEKNANASKGEIIGYIKIGSKKLYLHDKRGHLIEREPMCLLDFYVVPEYQRRGYGKKLFDHVLQDNRLSPKEMAFDGPTPSILEFIKKHYSMMNVVKLQNNFVMDESFFGDEELASDSVSGSENVTLTSNYHRPGRYSAVTPSTHVGEIIHGGGGDENRPTTSRGLSIADEDLQQSNQNDNSENVQERRQTYHNKLW